MRFEASLVESRQRTTRLAQENDRLVLHPLFKNSQ